MTQKIPRREVSPVILNLHHLLETLSLNTSDLINEVKSHEERANLL
jgi:hypothetical protein